MAHASSERNALVAIREEFDVLKAIYDDDIHLGPNNRTSATDNACLSMPVLLQCKVSEVNLLQFEIKDGFPHTKPNIKLVGPSPNAAKLEELIVQQLQIREEGYLYDAIEAARNWISENKEEVDNDTGNIKQDEVPVCKFFLMGKCRFGGKCTNRHPGSEAFSKEESSCIEKDADMANKNASTLVGNKEHRFADNDNPFEDKAPRMRQTTEKAVGKPAQEKSIRKEQKLPKQESEKYTQKKQSMKTATDVIQRILWDESLPTEKFTVGYLDRFIGIVEKPFSSFSWEDIASVDYSTLAIPKHRIQYFKYEDMIIWDKNTRVDKVFGSVGTSDKIHDVMRNYDETHADYNGNKGAAIQENSRKEQDFDDLESDDDDVQDDDDVASNQRAAFHKKWKEKDRPNYFYCFKVTNGLIKKGVSEVQEEIISCNDLIKDGCLKQSEMHVTLCMLRLNNDNEKQRALQVLESMQPILVCMLPRLRQLIFENLGNFRGRVLHVEVTSDAILCKFVNILLLKLKDSGLNACGNRDPYRPHMTIVKLSRPICRTLGSTQIDPTYYLRHINDQFGKQAIEKVYLCSTGKQRNDDGFYIELASKSNSLLCISDKLPEAIAKHVNTLVKQSILTEGEGDDLLQDLLSNDEEQFEAAVCSLDAIIDERNTVEFQNRSLFIMRGLQGSGKSYAAKNCIENTSKSEEAGEGRERDGKREPYDGDFTVCSADDYFENSPSGYSFSPSALADAHAYCRNKFIDAICNDVTHIVIDNTNSQCWEYQIYERIAKLCGYSARVLEISCKDEDTLNKFMDRSQHEVDKEAVHRTWSRWETDDSAVVIEPIFGSETKNVSLTELTQRSKVERKINAKEVLFSAFYLDNASSSRLLNEYPPTHSKLTANHMTLVHKPMPEQIKHIPVGKDHSVKIIGYVATDLLQAVAVKEIGDVMCAMEVPHITISHSKKAAPHHSKLALANKARWRQPNEELVLTGKIGVQVSVVNEKNSVIVTDASVYGNVCRQISENDASTKTAAKGSQAQNSANNDLMKDYKCQVDPSLYIGPETITSLFVFDFDGTLFRTPDPVIGRRQYQDTMGEPWPYKGWIGKTESLQWPLQTLPGPSYVNFKEHIGRACSLTVLLTGRIQSTLAGVTEVLREYGLHPEKCFLKPEGNSADRSKTTEKVAPYKTEVIKKLLLEYPNVRTVKIWDDRQDNIDAFRRMKRGHRDVTFELFKVGEEEAKDKKVRLKGGLNDNEIDRMVAEFGFGFSAMFQAAAEQGIEFITSAWASSLGVQPEKAATFVKAFGSFPLNRVGDVDLCLLAPSYLQQDECIVKLEAEILKRGVRHIHTATGIRCPRLKVRLHYLNMAPIDFDIIFAPCLTAVDQPLIDVTTVFQNGSKDVKAAVEGNIFLQKAQECISGKVSMTTFGTLVDLVVFYLKTKHLKGNAFHCIRTFHIVRALAEMISKSKETESSLAALLSNSFDHLASLDIEYWKRICRDFVPEEMLKKTMESFVEAVKMMNQSESRATIFAVKKFPPINHIVATVTAKSNIKEIQWRANTILEAKLGPCIRKLLALGVDVSPGPCDYDNIIRFTVPVSERNLKLCQNILGGLKGDAWFLENKDNLNLIIRVE